MKFRSVIFHLSLTSFLLLGKKTISQTIKCGEFYFESQMINVDTNYNTRRQNFEIELKDSIAAHHIDSLFARIADVEMDLITIPVVFHAIGAIAISAANPITVQQRLDDLNDLFRKIPGTQGFGTGVDVQIQFCLATKDENGNTSTGINNISGNFGPFSKTDADDIQIKSQSNWNPEKYLNIWICDLGLSAEKVWGSDPAMFLKNSDPTKKFRDGVVCDLSNFNAKILAHGIGHWLSLKHTYGDDGSTCGQPQNDDLCGDTPACFGSNNASGASCMPKPPQCLPQNGLAGSTNIRQTENYMDDSDISCIDKFTLGQKLRMQVTLASPRKALSQNQSAACPPGPTCSDNIKNGTEIEVDCGGLSCNACPDCATIGFKINGHLAYWWDMMNVCLTGPIILTPYTACSGNIKWRTSSVYAKVSGNTTSAAVNGGPPEQCDNNYCYYSYIYLSIQECDRNRNALGPESGTWFNLSGQTNSPIDLMAYFYYLGNPLVPGKYFRVKTAVEAENGWRTHSGFFKVLTQNLSLLNENITNSEVSNYITITNCTVPSLVNIVASNQIEIQPNTSLTSGNYFINPINCNNISTFRTSHSEGLNDNMAPLYHSSEQTYKKKNQEALSEKNKVKAFPNPNKGLFTVSFSSYTTGTIEIRNELGMLVYEQSVNNAKSVDLRLSNCKQGIYILRVLSTDIKPIKVMID